MAEPKATFWYLEPFDSDTNRICSENLAGEDVVVNIRCADGKRHNLWRCNHFEVQRFEDCRNQLRLRFRVFVQQGRCGAIREWKFERTGAKRGLVTLNST